MTDKLLAGLVAVSSLAMSETAVAAVGAKTSTVPAASAVSTLPPTEPIVTHSAGGLMTPMAVRLRKTTPREVEANAVWNVRAALNIAALQCQFSPFLATVRNYNDMLRQHSEELDRARIALVGHFRRHDAGQAQNSFDRYTTQTYNSFSTLDAQYSFCERAASAGREVLALRKGGLGAAAPRLRDEVRAALVPVAALALLVPFEITPEVLPPL